MTNYKPNHNTNTYSQFTKSLERAKAYSDMLSKERNDQKEQELKQLKEVIRIQRLINNR